MILNIFKNNKKEIILNKKQISLLEEYNIEYKNKSLKEILDNIDIAMIEFVDEEGIPKEEYEGEYDSLYSLYNELKK